LLSREVKSTKKGNIEKNCFRSKKQSHWVSW
jgi:hypothetical protein